MVLTPPRAHTHTFTLTQACHGSFPSRTQPDSAFPLRGRKQFHNSGAAHCFQGSFLLKHAGLISGGSFLLKGRCFTGDNGWRWRPKLAQLFFFFWWNLQWCQVYRKANCPQGLSLIQTYFQSDLNSKLRATEHLRRPELHVWAHFVSWEDQSISDLINQNIASARELEGGTKGPLRVTHAAADLHRWRWWRAPGEAGV